MRGRGHRKLGFKFAGVSGFRQSGFKNEGSWPQAIRDQAESLWAKCQFCTPVNKCMSRFRCNIESF